MNMLKKTATAVAAVLAMTGTAQAAGHGTQGVTDDEIVIGSNQDMSGVFAAFGAPAMQAAQMYFDEVNAAGGVHGRKIRLVVEDHAYQMPKAMSGLNKLVNSDKVFAMFMSLGTPMNIAAFPLLESKGIPNISPLTSARQMIEPPSDIKYAGFSSYFDQVQAGVKYLHEQEGASKVCAMFLPTDFGLEIEEGAKAAAEAMDGVEFVAETKHRPDELDFVGSLTSLKSEGCEVIAVALGVRQVITAIGTAKKMGWSDVKFLGSSASFHTAIAKVPGGVTDGFYAAAGWADLEKRMDNPAVAKFVKDYNALTGEALPGTGALLGYSGAMTFVRALEAAGPDLTHESFQAGMESLDFHDDIADAAIKYGPGDHLGGDLIVISKIENGSWSEIARQ